MMGAKLSGSAAARRDDHMEEVRIITVENPVVNGFFVVFCEALVKVVSGNPFDGAQKKQYNQRASCAESRPLRGFGAAFGGDAFGKNRFCATTISDAA